MSLNKYTAAGSAAFLYDANGNLTSDGANSFAYDIENRMVQVSGARSATLRYDPLGRLYETSAGTAVTTTRMLYDGDELVAEYSAPATGSPVLLRRYVHGSGNDDPLIWYEGAGIASTALRRLRSNHQGSIVAITDSAGAKLNINSYDEWGIPAATNIGRFQYTGQAWLPEIGMYYYRARIYSPTLGRFMQTDPIGYDDQVNLYAYVGNDPVNMVDPSGKCGYAGVTVFAGGAVVADGPFPVGDAIGLVACAGGLAVAAYNEPPIVVTGDPNRCGVFCSIGRLFNEKSPEDKRRGSAPTDAPRGTRPIDRTGIGRQGVHDVKDGIGAEPDDWVGVDPNGDIVTTDPQTGRAVPQGNIGDYGVERDKKPKDKRDEN